VAGNRKLLSIRPPLRGAVAFGDTPLTPWYTLHFDKRLIMTRWDKFKERFGLFTGVIGLVADTIAILGAIGAGFIMPSFSNMRIVSAALDTLILFTLLLGLYSLTMIVWFLFRWRRFKQEERTFGFDELYRFEGLDSKIAYLLFCLLPIVGAFGSVVVLPSMRVIFWFAVFISLLPATFWFYTSHGHKLRFFERLKIQCEQRV
jgi:hypothetical protein